MYEQPYMESGSVNFNILRMIEDHVPIRLNEIQEEIRRLEQKINALQHEHDTLNDVYDALQITPK